MFARRLLLVGGLMLLATSALYAAEVAPQAKDIRVADDGLFDRLDANSDGQLQASELPSEQARLFARLVRLGDENGDGSLNAKEWKRANQPRRPAKPIEEKRSAELPGADAARLLLLKLDTNSDAVLSEEEASEELQPTFKRIVEQYDRNDDGRVNRLELSRGGPRLTRMAQQTARRLDWNVQRELKELDRQQGEASMRFSKASKRTNFLRDPNQTLALFEQLDKNKDGKIERDEVPEQAADRYNRLFRLGDRNEDNALSQKEFQNATRRAGRMLQRMSAGDPK